MSKQEQQQLLLKNYQFFIKKLPSLLKDEDKKNKFAVIKDKKIVGFYESIEDAMIEAKEKNIELGTFLVQKIEKEQVHRISRTA